MNKKVVTLIISIIVITLIIAGVVITGNMNKTKNDQEQSEERNNIQSEISQGNQTENISIIDNDNNTNNSETDTNNNSKILVVFFSKAGGNYSVGTVEVGNTELMAKNIADMTNADLFKIEPLTDYPDDYRESTEVATEEKNSNTRPEIKNKISNIDDYDTIFIGYPIWWGDMPMILYTFLESYDFSGKTIIPFNTHEGSGNSGTYSSIKSKLTLSNVIEGLAIKGSEARQDSSKTTIQSWLNKIGF